MKLLSISIFISVLLLSFSLYDLGLTYYESIIAQFSIVVVSLYFILNIANLIDREERKYYIVEVLFFIILSTILFAKVEKYRISQYISVSLILANLYVLSYLFFYKLIKYSILRRVIIFFILILSISGVYSYTEKKLKIEFNEDEALKDIYIEAGAIMDRELTYYYLNKIKDCNKFRAFQKRLIESDKELKNNEIIKAILDKKIKVRNGKILNKSKKLKVKN